ncbi:hypothetical protein CONLIGDRAFT_640183 [Coniochaeta ligniaria NRRL 30616]|uniref:Uncharacterized protein n=1 Tax=Coniochaeta ligniaria NRRL 30616 TaxID=1408157 RepID=A0A1J7JSR3_9PEZI|nr:hypothetical protein CONLIGDRAFT_640183 [Coniochaeta ligniaria NRRL 30616]
MVFDDTEMGTGYLSPHNPLGTNMEADWQDQSGAGLQDFNMDDSNYVDPKDIMGLLHSPSAEKTEFNFDSGSTKLSGDDQASLAQPSTQAEEAVEGYPPPVVAASSLTLPQDPAPEQATNGANSQLTMPDSGLPSSNPEPTPVDNSNQRIPTPSQTTLDSGFPISDEDMAAFEATLKNLPETPSDGTMAGPGTANSYMPQQPYTAQPQPVVQSPNMTGMPRQSMYMPLPQRPLAPGNMLSTLNGYPPTAPQQPYMVQPLNMVNMPPTYSTNPYPSYQHPPPAPMQPGFPTSYAPPQPLPPQLSNGYLQPAPDLYQPYGCVSQLKSELKRKADEDDLQEGLPPSKKIRHRRDGNRRESNRPSHWYRPLPGKPTAWSPAPKEPSGRPGSPPAKTYREPLFKYNDNGELLGNVRYSRDELWALLVGKTEDGGRPAPSRRGKLTMWIQYAPAFEGHRYGAEASICRWDECPVKKNTISKGQFRVAFDERAETSGVTTDPFHCAGYMHLYCFEEAFNLYGFFFDGRFSIQPDRRVFRHEEKNPMALSGTLVGVLDAWIQSEGKARREGGQRGARLWRVLTEAHTAGPGYLEKLDKQNDVHVGKYMGDLRLYQQMKDEKLRLEREGRAIEIEDDEDDEGLRSRSAITQYAAQHSPQREAERSQVTERPIRRPSLPRYSPPARRQRLSPPVEDVQAPHHQVQRPSVALYKPPASRKRSRSEHEDEAPAYQAPSSKRSKVDLAEIEATVRQGLRKRNQQEIRRVSRILTSMVAAVDGMPHYKRLGVESLVSREADRVRRGLVRRYGSLPTGVGCRT